MTAAVDRLVARVNGPTMALSNICCSVGIIFVNKLIFEKEQFKFPIILTSFHFVTTLLFIRFLKWLELFDEKDVPRKELLLYTLCRVGSVVFMNFTLVLNNMGFYQLSKLLLTPTTIFFQTTLYQERFSIETYLSLLIISVGIGIVQVTDPSMNFWGTVVAALGVLSTTGVGLYQKYRVKPFGLSSFQLMFKQTPWESALMVALVPAIEPLATLEAFPFTPNLVTLVLLSCVLAVGVTITSFLTVMKLSPVTYQVCGHLKTVFLLVLNVTVFGAVITGTMWAGLLLAATGIAWYMKIDMDAKAKKAAGVEYTKVTTEEGQLKERV